MRLRSPLHLLSQAPRADAWLSKFCCSTVTRSTKAALGVILGTACSASQREK
jgi:hypothetical protein